MQRPAGYNVASSPIKNTKRLVVVFIVCALLSAAPIPLQAQQNGGQTAATSAAIAAHELAVKQAEVTRTIVAPCKGSADSLVKPALEHYKICDCFSSEKERQKTLAAIRLALQQTYARCDLKGLDAQLAYIDQREADVRAKLREAIRTFQAQSASFTSWGSDATSGEKEAQDKLPAGEDAGALGAT